MPREVLGDLLRALGQNPTQAEVADIVASAPREGAWFGLSLTAAEAYQWYGGIGGALHGGIGVDGACGIGILDGSIGQSTTRPSSRSSTDQTASSLQEHLVCSFLSIYLV